MRGGSWGSLSPWSRCSEHSPGSAPRQSLGQGRATMQRARQASRCGVGLVPPPAVLGCGRSGSSARAAASRAACWCRRSVWLPVLGFLSEVDRDLCALLKTASQLEGGRKMLPSRPSPSAEMQSESDDEISVSLCLVRPQKGATRWRCCARRGMLRSPCSCLPGQLAPRVRTRTLASLIRPTRSPLGSTAQLDAALWTRPRPSASTSSQVTTSGVSRQTQKRGVCDKQQFRTRHGNIRINLVRVHTRWPCACGSPTRC